MRTADLTGRALDYAVALAAGYSPQARHRDQRVRVTWANPVPGTPCPAFSTDWAQGGPIIEREQIGFVAEARDGAVWKAQFSYARRVLRRDPIDLVYSYCLQRGSTPLIASMRCYVASKIGDEIDLPKELEAIL